jgi:predicted transcriptional regulator
VKKTAIHKMSKRERQIMDIIFRLGEATAEQVVENFPEAVGDASIRKLIRVMEHKGYLQHKKEGRCYVYQPVLSKETASRQAVKHILKTYFFDSTPMAVSALLDVKSDSLTSEEIAKIIEMINEAKKKGR